MGFAKLSLPGAKKLKGERYLREFLPKRSVLMITNKMEEDICVLGFCSILHDYIASSISRTDIGFEYLRHASNMTDKLRVKFWKKIFNFDQYFIPPRCLPKSIIY